MARIEKTGKERTAPPSSNRGRMKYRPALKRLRDVADTEPEAGYFAEAATAYRNAIEWGIPEDITNWHALAETLIQANNGRITGEAQKALENVLRYRPDDPKAIYFLGLARIQNKEPQKALALWRYLEQILSAEDPWLTVVHERIETLQDAIKTDPRAVKHGGR